MTTMISLIFCLVGYGPRCHLETPCQAFEELPFFLFSNRRSNRSLPATNRPVVHITPVVLHLSYLSQKCFLYSPDINRFTRCG
ncbi:uncharacterized protein GGS25DRAFT_508920 [Hypoxylon fragiforme]|uniref:uncharacterized protein n=1 Tax=Hypoxylon fragiforme TaxID=63214 RepID=UPI0020C62893|nr:uncharacterized protein GGS25DRAFT_508920 [Hypoxylon fragiforme]KAI2604576.1 hypothetical protein GGS25DRAFT_508920 [Hypoxylon fragiforme]